MNIDSLFSKADHHPVVITPGSDTTVHALREYLKGESATVRCLLLQHGGILFRGFDLHGADDFQRCAESAGARPFPYLGGDSPRSRVAADVYTSTEYPASEVISLHQEMSYLPRRPRRLFFYSAIPPRTGGQTSLAHSRDILRALSPDVVRAFREKQINYIRSFPPTVRLAKSWQDTYRTKSRSDVEYIAANQGSTCQWSADGALQVRTLCPALVQHPDTGEKVWFNQAELWHPSALNPTTREVLEEMVGAGRLPHDCEYGNGELMDSHVLKEIRGVLASCKLLFDWRRGDLLMLDNFLLMHGREAFSGERKIFAYLSST